MLYILHGPNDVEYEEILQNLKRRLGDPATVDLNTTLLDGKGTALPDLERACGTIPFLAERRLVLVRGLLGTLRTRRSAKGTGGPGRIDAAELNEYLRVLPETTILLLREPELVQPSLPVMILAIALAREDPPRAYVKAMGLPPQHQLAQWIQSRARKRGGEMEPAAAQTLAMFAGENARLLDQEIEKLVSYAGQGKAVTRADVETLVADSRAADIFEFVDAVTVQDSRSAFLVLHRLLEQGNVPLVLLA